MYFYYFTILLFFFPTLLETSNPVLRGQIPYKKSLIIFVVALCIFQMGLRWETGTDWNAYLDHFNSQNYTNPLVNDDVPFELGYNLMVSLSKFLVNDYSFFLLIHAIVFFLLIKKGYEYFTPYPIVALLLFYVSFLGIWGSSRQLLAMGIGMLSMIYLYEKRWWPYVVCIFIAFQFHTTSLLLLTFIFLRKKFSNFNIIAALLICLAIGSSSLPLKLFSLFGGVNELTSSKATAYLKQAEEVNFGFSFIGLVKRLCIFIIFFIYRKKISKIDDKFNFIFNGYLFGLCFYFLFVQTLAVMISRGSLYFNVLEPVLLSYIFCITKNKKVSFLFMIVILIYSILMVKQSIITYPELFDPYKGIFINADYQRNMF